MDASGDRGVAGFFTGDSVGRFGLRSVLLVGFCTLGVAIGTLGLAPVSLPAVLFSAVLFGASVMLLGALFAVWSAEVFGSQSGAGLSVVVMVITVGQIVGSVAAGFIAGSAGLGVAFMAAAVLALATGLIRPHEPSPA